MIYTNPNAQPGSASHYAGHQTLDEKTIFYASGIDPSASVEFVTYSSPSTVNLEIPAPTYRQKKSYSAVEPEMTVGSVRGTAIRHSLTSKLPRARAAFAVKPVMVTTAIAAAVIGGAVLVWNSYNKQPDVNPAQDYGKVETEDLSQSNLNGLSPLASNSLTTAAATATTAALFAPDAPASQPAYPTTATATTQYADTSNVLTAQRADPATQPTTQYSATQPIAPTTQSSINRNMLLRLEQEISTYENASKIDSFAVKKPGFGWLKQSRHTDPLANDEVSKSQARSRAAKYGNVALALKNLRSDYISGASTYNSLLDLEEAIVRTSISADDYVNNLRHTRRSTVEFAAGTHRNPTGSYPDNGRVHTGESNAKENWNNMTSGYAIRQNTDGTLERVALDGPTRVLHQMAAPVSTGLHGLNDAVRKWRTSVDNSNKPTVLKVFPRTLHDVTWSLADGVSGGFHFFGDFYHNGDKIVSNVRDVPTNRSVPMSYEPAMMDSEDSLKAGLIGLTGQAARAYIFMNKLSGGGNGESSGPASGTGGAEIDNAISK